MNLVSIKTRVVLSLIALSAVAWPASTLARAVRADDAPQQNGDAQNNDATQGTTEGVLTGKGNGFILVRADGDKESTHIYPRFIPGTPQQGGGMDKRILAIFQQLALGSRLKVTWIRDKEHVRAVDIEVLAATGDDDNNGNGDQGNGDQGNGNQGDGDNGNAGDNGGNNDGNGGNDDQGGNDNGNAGNDDHPDNDAKTGAFDGILNNKGIEWVSVRPDGEQESTRFVPRWIGGTPAQGGGPDKDVLRAIDQIPVGAHVHTEWLRDAEHLRVVSLRLVSDKPHDAPAQK